MFNGASMEIERRFLIKRIPTNLLTGSKSEKLISAYIERTSKHKLRARKIGNKFLLTEKNGAGVIREEKEREISEEEFNKLSKDAIEVIKKTRYYVPHGNLVLEIDVYEDSIKYPATVEIEFKSKELAASFAPPGWFGEEMAN